MFFSLLHQPLAQFVGILQVCRKMLVTILAFVLLREEVEVVARVVVELVGIAGVERFGVAEDVGHHFRVLFQNRRVAYLTHIFLRAVHREDHRRGDHLVTQTDVLAVLIHIGADGEAQALHERANLTRGIAVIDGGAEYQHVSLSAKVQIFFGIIASAG